jgi:hypothetical protein
MLATGARLMVNGLIGTEPAIIPLYVYLTVLLITLDNKSKKNCICDEYVINLFVCIYEVRKDT